MNQISVMSIKITPAVQMRGELVWDPKMERKIGQRAVDLAAEVGKYCQKNIPREWRKDVVFRACKGIFGGAWVEAYLYAEVTEKFDHVEWLYEFFDAIRNNFREACEVLTKIIDLNPDSPGSIAAVPGPKQIFDGKISAPKPVIDLTNIIREHCGSTQDNALKIAVGDEEFDVQYHEPRGAIISNEIEPTLYIGEFFSVCDHRLVAGFKISGGKSLTLSYPVGIRNNLLDSQRGRQIVSIRVLEQYQAKCGNNRVVGGFIQEFLGEVQPDIFTATDGN